ncbi:AraC family transcriptional regulator [Thiohalophilus sp.]|uniref:helix-turn-helix domain-containing protein n=1 Tax=Thiohalophilus sp. TaxID=3028392 RepID=UPI002ACEF438|nr:AraC family transcriptional regulator [Thiohalophilus sp.]MDZ7662743.1 AraC family transcriptional regulator [Thiohalophilus sp.]
MPDSSRTPEPSPVQHHDYPPPAPLRPFVRRILHSYSAEATSTTIAVPPTGAHYITHVYGAPMQMQYSYNADQPCPALFVGGQLKSEVPVARIDGKVGLLGIEFYPTGFYRLFRQDCSAFTDCMTDFARVVPEHAAALNEALSLKTDTTSRLETLEHFLSHFADNAEQTPGIDQAVALIENQGGYLRVEELAQKCHWSPKQLYRYFMKIVGVSPKHFAKIVQINGVVAQIHAGSYEGLHQLALQCGYYDQAHFIRDFQRLIGTNPLAFLQHPDPFLKTYLGRVGSPDS